MGTATLTPADLAQLRAGLAPLQVEGAERAVLCSAAGHLRAMRNWLDGADVAVARALRELERTQPTTCAEHTLADQGRTSLRDAGRTVERSRTADTVPELGALLDAGTVSAAHVDVVTGVLRRLEPDDRQQLVQHGQRVADLAEHHTPDEFRQRLDSEMRRWQQHDTVTNFERQRRATRLNVWTDRTSGMVRLAGEFDPETGGELLRRISRQVETMFHDRHPDTAPDDPLDRQRHLQALALHALVVGSPGGVGAGAAGGGGRAAIGVIVDHTTLVHGLHPHTLLDAGGLHLPVETVRRMACDALLLPIVLDGRGVALDVGRAQRLATAAQRAALRAMYPTCEVPGCDVPFDYCTPHHIAAWQHGGPSNLVNFAVLCSRHHHCAHEGGWQLAKGAEFVLHVTMPDGTVTTGTMPRARAPATPAA